MKTRWSATSELVEIQCKWKRTSMAESQRISGKKNGSTLSSNALLQLHLICKAVLCMGRLGELSLHINANLYLHFGSRS